MKYKPWHDNPETLILPYLLTQSPPEPGVEMHLRSVFETPAAKKVIPSLENEIRQSLSDLRVKHVAEQ